MGTGVRGAPPRPNVVMGNKTNASRWSAQERLAHVERVIYWRGWVRRADICDRFGVSLPQASADIAEYMRRNPSALRYDPSGKRYEATKQFKCRLTLPSLAEATVALADSGDIGAVDFARVEMPARSVPEAVARDVVRAIANRTVLDVYYYSVNSGTEGWRQIAPLALGHDGFRWHARAWCLDERAFKDFVLGRMGRVRASAAVASPPFDEEWNTWTTIRFRPNSKLNGAQRTAMELDFGMVRGLGILKVRKAMKLYAEVYLGLMPTDTMRLMPRLELAEG